MKSKNEDIARAILEIAYYGKIVHHLPGRIRLRFGPGVKKVLGRYDLKEILTSMPGILSYRMNAKIGSLLVEYDTGLMEMSLWEDIIKAYGDKKKCDVVEKRLLELFLKSNG